MASGIIYPQGGEGTEIVVPAGSKIAVYSRDRVKVFTKQVFTNAPSQWVLYGTAAADTEPTFGAFTNQTIVRIQAGADIVKYSVGTAPVIFENRGRKYTGSITAVDVTGAVSASAIFDGIVTSSTAAAVAGTVPTGTVLDATSSIGVGDCFDWSVINTGGSNAFTVTAATGHTLVGNAVVAASSSGRFRTRKTAANTFVTYRL